MRKQLNQYNSHGCVFGLKLLACYYIMLADLATEDFRTRGVLKWDAHIGWFGSW
jgi:hypothetical protein